jgi:putative protease
LRAAVANGADAVYFGLSAFNARHRATNFTLEELPTVMGYLHQRNVRGYVAFNTLIFSGELGEAARFVSAIAAAGADAVIVQDLGLASLIHRMAPALPLHASTQMTLTEPRGIDFVKRLGIERVILARELSAEEVQRVASATDVPLEVFVHGALCVAYSGQCLTSEALGGRSANRGQCAQACRMPYEMFVDGQRRDLGDRAYLLSPQDLAAYDLIEPLVQSGVACFKIEGRLKGAAYVAATTQTYRAALDAALAGRLFSLSRQGQLDLEQSFSRGFSHGFLGGVNHQVLVQGRFPKSRGVRVGTVVGRTGRGVVVALAGQHIEELVKPGDGVVFDEGHPEEEEQGGRVFAVHVQQGGEHPRVELTFGQGDVRPKQVQVGSRVWKTDDPAFRKRMERSFVQDVPARKVPLDFRLRGVAGGPLELEASDEEGHTARVSWPGPLERARQDPAGLVHEQLRRLGDTPFELRTVALELAEPLLIPRSVLNELRRQAVAQLLELRKAARRATVVESDTLDHWRGDIATHHAPSESGNLPRLAVLVRSLEQLDAVLGWSPESPLSPPSLVYCDFEDVRRYKEAVARARTAGMPIGLATLRIVKPGEDGLLRQVASQGADVLLVRNLAALSVFKEAAPETQLVGDFSLNVANELTANLLLGQGLALLVPSYDLNWEQLSAMLGRIDSSRFEVVAHQHMPLFHMEHCVYAAFLSDGKDWRDCGRPCDHHKVELRDRVGAEFPVLVDVGCRNTVYNAVAQSAAEFLPRMLALGLRHFRVELLRETPEQVGPLLEQYARVLAGLDDGRGTWRSLRVLNQLGVTRGTLQLV